MNSPYPLRIPLNEFMLLAYHHHRVLPLASFSQAAGRQALTHLIEVRGQTGKVR